MSIIVEAPNEVYSLKNNENIKLFLAGGITNCPDWQSVMIEKLKDIPNLTIYNPRRKNFPIEDSNAAEAQITWEFNHLRDADIVLFWFSRGSLNPIVLFELGKMIGLNKKIIIGIDPEYERKRDVEIQSKLSIPDIRIEYSFEGLERLVEEFIQTRIYSHERY